MTISGKRGYVGWEHLFDPTNVHVFTTLIRQGLVPEDKLLDVGAGMYGPGRYIMLYLNPGNYVAVEPAKWLLIEAINEIGNLPIKRGVTDYQFSNFKLSEELPAGLSFNWVLAHSILTHADQKQAKTLFAEAYKVLRVGGRFCATYSWGGIDNPVKGWTYPSGVLYSNSFIRDAARAAGFGEPEIIEPSGAISPLDSHPAFHCWVICQRN